MITEFKIFEGFIKKEFKIKKEIVNIFYDIDEDIMKHIDIEVRRLNDYYVKYDDVTFFFINYKDINNFSYINNIFHKKDVNSFNFDSKNLMSYIKDDLSKMYNLTLSDDDLSIFFQRCFSTDCLFFNKEIFNDRFKEFVSKYGSIIDNISDIKKYLSEDNIKELDYLINANNFDLI